MIPQTSPTTVTSPTTGYGCRYCGCTCGGGTGCYPSPAGNVFVIGWDLAPARTERERRLDDLIRDIKIAASFTSIPIWVLELIATPRRMKRPFPHHHPGPPLCHSNFRLRVRGLSRAKLHRIRMSRASRSSATAASRTHSRNGKIARPATVRQLLQSRGGGM